MNICGIIAEYNPFHLGHAYHMDQARRLSQCDAVVVAMSGQAVQRGEPALVDKWQRARMALEAGADLVLELPAGYVLQPAEWFTMGGVMLLESLGVVTHIAFGAELPDLSLLSGIAHSLLTEPPELSQEIRNQLHQGISFPRARSSAVSKLMKELKIPGDAETVGKALSSPNSILAIHYLQSLERIGSGMIPLVVPRIGSGYLTQTVEDRFSSATAIRRAIISGDQIPSECLPYATSRILSESLESGQGPVTLASLDSVILHLIRSSTADALLNLPDMAEGLHQKFWKEAQYAATLQELLDRTLSKRYTQTRLQRALMHLWLGMDHAMVQTIRTKRPLYARVLGMRRSASPIVRSIQEKSRIPLVMRPARFYPDDPSVKQLWDLDIHASDVYSLALQDRTARLARRDMTHGLILL